ncbi:MAG: hypothetical protein FJY76_03925 [Candidatus Aenigmarchaeota archaeon]|nr:hypothetical protein [Candidatus Aenigmarchaeota archaeon]
MARSLFGQTEAVSLVLISGIVVSLVGAAYFWGMPLIEKRAASTDFTSASNLITDINKKILSLANAGGGKAEIELSKPVTLVPAEAQDNNNNSLIVTYGVRQPIIYPSAEGGTLYLGATNFGDASESIGVFGQSSPGVITVRQNVMPEGNYYILSTKLWYRQLRTSGAQVKSYVIKLCGDTDITDCNKQSSGTGKLILSFKSTETIPGNPDLVVTKIGVKLT